MASRRTPYVPHPCPRTRTDNDFHWQLLARSAAIRNNWKTRQGAPTGPAPAPQKPHALPAKPAPPPPPVAASLPPKPPQLADVPPAEARYGPLAASRWSKVTGPEMVAGMYR